MEKQVAEPNRQASAVRNTSRRPPRRRRRGLGAMKSSIIIVAIMILAAAARARKGSKAMPSPENATHEIRHGTHFVTVLSLAQAQRVRATVIAETEGNVEKVCGWFGCSPACGSTGPSHHCGHRSGCSGSCTLSPRRAAPRPAQNWGFTMPLHPFSELEAWTNRGQGTLRTRKHGRQGVGDGAGAVLAHVPAGACDMPLSRTRAEARARAWTCGECMQRKSMLLACLKEMHHITNGKEAHERLTGSLPPKRQASNET